MLIDTHAHLQDDMLYANVENIVKDAKDNKVEKIICSSNNLETSQKACEISNRFENVFATVGYHPENCLEFDECSIDKLKQLCANKKVVAIGEIGLDYHYTKETKQIQKEIFIKQLDLAVELGLPVTVHTRDAIFDTLEILKNYKGKLKNCVIHCFSESVEILKIVMDYGFYISVGGIMTFNNAKTIKEVLKQVDIHKLMLETDCPYLAPVPFRGQVNESKYVFDIFQFLCFHLKRDCFELEKILEENTKNCYNI